MALILWDDLSNPITCVERPHNTLSERYELSITLDHYLLLCLQVPLAPMYHSLPAYTYRANRRQVFPSDIAAYEGFVNENKVGTADIKDRPVADVVILDIDVQETVFRPFLERLRSHPRFGSLTASWLSGVQSPTEYHSWDDEKGLQHWLMAQLFSVVNSILSLLPLAPGQRIEIVREGDTTIPGHWKFGKISDFYGINLVGPGQERQCLLVIEVKPRVSMAACDHMASAQGKPVQSTRRHPTTPEERVRFPCLHQLGVQMLASNAPIGIVFTGTYLLVYEKDYGLDRVKRLQILAYRRMSSEGGGVDCPDTSIFLKSWGTSFAHPADYAFLTPRFMRANWCLVIPSVVVRALDLSTTIVDPDPLYQPPLATLLDDNYDISAFDHLDFEWRGPRDFGAGEDPAIRQPVCAVYGPTRTSMPPSELVSLDVTKLLLPLVFLCRSSPAGPVPSLADIPADADEDNCPSMLVAFGFTPERRHYLALCPLGMSHRGSTSAVYRGSLYLSRSSASTFLGPFGYQATTAMPSTLECPGAETSNLRPCLEDCLYLASGTAATTILAEAKTSFIPHRNIVIKVPLLQISEDQDPQPSGDSAYDGIEDRVSAVKELRDTIANESRILSVISSEGAATARKSSLRDSAPLPALQIKLSSAFDPDQLDRYWPGLSSVLDQKHFQVLPDVGPSVQELLDCLGQHDRRGTNASVRNLDATVGSTKLDESNSRNTSTATSQEHLRCCREILKILESRDIRIALSALQTRFQSALDCLHSQGIVHSDVHPGNLCIQVASGPDIPLAGPSSPVTPPAQQSITQCVGFVAAHPSISSPSSSSSFLSPVLNFEEVAHTQGVHDRSSAATKTVFQVKRGGCSSVPDDTMLFGHGQHPQADRGRKAVQNGLLGSNQFSTLPPLEAALGAPIEPHCSVPADDWMSPRSSVTGATSMSSWSDDANLSDHDDRSPSPSRADELDRLQVSVIDFGASKYYQWAYATQQDVPMNGQTAGAAKWAAILSEQERKLLRNGARQDKDRLAAAFEELAAALRSSQNAA